MRILLGKSILVLLFLALFSADMRADDVIINRKGKRIELNGQVLVAAQDGGLMFQTPDGHIWLIQPDEIVESDDNEQHPEPLKNKELGVQLQAELPDGFKIHHAGDFVIAYSTERTYARWVGGLYQRLHRGFDTHWQRKKFKTKDPDYPLAVIIFSNKAEYERYMAKELGEVSPGLVAYYNLQSNRVAMYDLTADRNDGHKRQISEVLADPRSIQMVATVIHEGTHQLMFNTGMQVRMSDTPLWLNEGLAMYFETPDLSSKRGWRAIGRVNHMRLVHFKKSRQRRPADWLTLMLTSDKRFRESTTALDAYAESWAFCYFLLKEYEEKFVDYLKFMSQKPQQKADGHETRVSDFKKFLGEDLQALEREFLRYIEKLPLR